MKSLLTAIGTIIILLMLAACSGSGRSNSDTAPGGDTAVFDSRGRTVRTPREVNDIIDAVLKRDAARFAASVSYPLARPYPLRDVDDSAKMAIYFPVMIDDSLRTILRKSRSEEWTSNGWRGWTLADGRYLWIDEKLYELSYVSHAERDMRATLANEEIASLEPAMRPGWHPAFCLRGIDTGTLYRVDRHDDSPEDSEEAADRPDNEHNFRLAIYNPGVNLHGHPSQIMNGRIDIEGSERVRTYYFYGADGSRARYVYDIVSDDQPMQIMMTGAAGDTTVYNVERVYWRDFLANPGDTVIRQLNLTHIN